MCPPETVACHRVVIEPRSPLPEFATPVPEVVLLDLAACPEPDSHLVARLTVLARDLKRRGCRCVHIVNASAPLAAVIRVLGIDRVVHDAA